MVNPLSGATNTAQRIFVRPIAEGKRGEAALSSEDSQLLLALGRSLRLSPAELERLIAEGALNQPSCCLGPVLVRIGAAEHTGAEVSDLRVFIQSDGLTMLNNLSSKTGLCLRLGNSAEEPIILHFALPELSEKTLRRLTDVHIQEALGRERASGNCLVVGPFGADISSCEEEELELSLQEAVPDGTVRLLKSPGHSPHGFLCEFGSAEEANWAKKAMISKDNRCRNHLLDALNRVDIHSLPTVTRIDLPPILRNLITKDHLYALRKSSRNNTLPTKSGPPVRTLAKHATHPNPSVQR
jgi:hypothetical protein